MTAGGEEAARFIGVSVNGLSAVLAGRALEPMELAQKAALYQRSFPFGGEICDFDHAITRNYDGELRIGS